MYEGELAISKEEGRVARYRLLKELDGCEIILSCPRYVNTTIIDELLCAKIKIIGSEIFCRSLLDGRFLCRGELGLKLVGDFLRFLALDGEDVRKVAVIFLGPDMRVIAGID